MFQLGNCPSVLYVSYGIYRVCLPAYYDIGIVTCFHVLHINSYCRSIYLLTSLTLLSCSVLKNCRYYLYIFYPPFSEVSSLEYNGCKTPFQKCQIPRLIKNT